MRDACSGNPDRFLFTTLTATLLSVLGGFRPIFVPLDGTNPRPYVSHKVHLTLRHDIEIQVMNPACGVR
jgi:hypothetical protein